LRCHRRKGLDVGKLRGPRRAPDLHLFSVSTAKAGDIISPEFKEAGSRISLLQPSCDESGQPDLADVQRITDQLES
jgi:phosphoribosylformylglycinamidine synthase